MQITGKDPEAIPLRGGLLCLDFANTVDWDADGRPVKDEALTDPDALARWGRRLGVWAAAPAVEAAELVAVRGLRGSVHAVLAAIAHGSEPDAADLDRIARDHAAAARAGHLAPAAACAWRLDWAPDDPRRVRFAAAVDAVLLLADAERLARVRHCPGHDCGWLFFDTSGRRRWCSMDSCGSRAKMRRLYERQRVSRSMPA